MMDRSVSMIMKSVSKLIVVVFFLLAGCAANVLVVDRYGMPVPHEVVSLDSLYNISCTFYFVRLYEKHKESIYPEYLRMEEWVNIPEDTTDVALVFNILNPNRKHLRIVKRLKVDGVLATEILYEGNGQNLTFQLKGPVNPGAKVELSADIKVKGLMILSAGRALYRVVRNVELYTVE